MVPSVAWVKPAGGLLYPSSALETASVACTVACGMPWMHTASCTQQAGHALQQGKEQAARGSTKMVGSALGVTDFAQSRQRAVGASRP